MSGTSELLSQESDVPVPASRKWISEVARYNEKDSQVSAAWSGRPAQSANRLSLA